ncbi:TetR/AcrR family transcriptional regulator [Arthrobacter sp. PAMC 25486]|uniref:TetR/AcrR family transcriptional regulator n=1 Tax=Arthrobacter sp. PAMC 25486 TaxID=1494608 RepID=UPI00068E71AE|nr:TetR/AcrR family transcriptional regulator [Arthrobacter sp. PAMC 25486]
MMIQIPDGRARLSRDESREQTRRRLVDAATELFTQFGVSDTSLNTVAEHAGYSRGAFHSNFGDKAELAEAVALSATSMIGPTIDALLVSPIASGARLEDYIRSYLRFCADEPLKTSALIAVVGFQSRFDTVRFESRMKESLRGIIGLFKDGQQRDEMRPFDPWLMAYMLRTTLDAAAARLAARALPTSVDETIGEIVTIFELATRKETR